LVVIVDPERGHGDDDGDLGEKQVAKVEEEDEQRRKAREGEAVEGHRQRQLGVGREWGIGRDGLEIRTAADGGLSRTGGGIG
jgi:hypothetical protein